MVWTPRTAFCMQPFSAWTICVLMACVLLPNAAPRATADGPQWIGRSSCGSATCHGGLIDRGPAWHMSDSVWMSKDDAHLFAGNVLLSDLSKRIAIALEPTATQDQAFHQLLKDRCVSCHAPSVAMTNQADTKSPAEFEKKLAEGVSCEACHGPAGNWVSAHTRVDWEKKGSERFTPQFGMKDTESLASRTQNCTGCHVGSRSQDGLVRDMNHDMIAAGHPPLYFDMWQAQHRMPVHWDERQEKLAAVTQETAASVYTELRLHVLSSAQRLSQERIAHASSGTGFAPELSEFDCAACHHVLATNSPRLRRGSAGQTLWHPWYTAGLLPTELRRGLGINVKGFETELQKVQQLLVQNPKSDSPADGAARLRQLLSTVTFDNGSDYNELPAWLDEIEAMLAKADSLPPETRKSLIQATNQAREKLIQSTVQTHKTVAAGQTYSPLPIARLMPLPWDAPAAEQTRRQLQAILVPSAKGTQQ